MRQLNHIARAYQAVPRTEGRVCDAYQLIGWDQTASKKLRQIATRDSLDDKSLKHVLVFSVGIVDRETFRARDLRGQGLPHR